MNIQDKLIAKYGYPAEVHTVTTDDGYILTMHRIRGKPGAQPFFLQHGLVDSSAGYVIMGPNVSLGKFFYFFGFFFYLFSFGVLILFSSYSLSNKKNFMHD